MLGIVSLTALLNYDYEKMMERLAAQWPAAWGLICQAVYKARADRLEKIRNFVTEIAQGKTMPADWGAHNPWRSCFHRVLNRDGQEYGGCSRSGCRGTLCGHGRGSASWQRGPQEAGHP